MSEMVADLAGLDSAVDTSVDTGAVNSTQEVDTGVDQTTEVESTETESGAQDSVKTDAASQQTPDKGSAQTSAITKALKSLADSNPNDPTLKALTKTLRDSYFGEQAFRKEFPGGLKAAKEFKTFVSEVSGLQNGTIQQARESYANTQALVTNIEETDALVHAGDSQVWQNIIEDLKSENHMDALPKLVDGGLEALREHNPNAFDTAIRGHLIDSLSESGFDAAINQIWAALRNNDVTAAKSIVKQVGEWYQNQRDIADKAKQQNSESAKLATERAKWESEKQSAQQKQFREGVATACDSYSNKALGAALKPYLKMPFFKGFKREALVDLGNGIKDLLYQTLQNDQAYQTQMKGLWGAKSPNKDKIDQIHRSTLDRIAKSIVDQKINQRYPGFAKGGSAAGRVAAATAAKETASAAAAKSIQTNTPIYVAQKPKDLIREKLVAGGREYGPSDLTMLEIGGKGFVRSTDGKYRFITWRKG